MAKFEIKKQESKAVGTATFDKKEDYITIKLNGSNKNSLVHKIQGEKLIKEKKAKLVDVEIKEVKGASVRTKVEVEKENN